MAVATNGTKNGTHNRITDLPVKSQVVVIAQPNFQVATFKIRGTEQYVQNKFSEKARQQMQSTQEAGSTAKKGKKRDPKDFKKNYEDCQYRSHKGEHGIPAGAFRNAMVSACRTVGFAMTKAKLAFFVLSNINDDSDIGTPLVKITKGKPKMVITPARNDNGSIDLRARAHFDPGWEATVSIRYDADIFTLSDVTNLLMRVGVQVGVGEGRPDSKDSCGMGWGLFEIVE